MASTNKTTHYNLSQYVGSDKPTYLVDYNTDMSNIDTAIYNAKSEADTNSTSIGTLSSLETSVKTDLVSAVNELKGKTDGIGNLSNLTTEANTTLVAAINEVDAEADANNQNIGTMTNLETTVKSSLVGAINEVNGKIPTSVAGIIQAYAGSVAPTGYLICDGSAVSRTTYANLFTAIGTTYGDGNGTTTFNLPNLKGKVIVGLDSNDTSFNSLGTTGGTKTHTLTLNEIPSHTHQYSESVGDGWKYGDGDRQNVRNNSQSSQTGSAGGGQPHNNLQPYITLNYIISI